MSILRLIVNNVKPDTIEVVNYGAGAYTAMAASDDGTKLVGVGYNQGIETSTDAGKYWKQHDVIQFVAKPWVVAASSSTGQHLIAGHIGNSNIAISNDFGATWSWRMVNPAITAFVQTAMSSDGKTMIALGNESLATGTGVYISTDYGTTWVKKYSSGSGYSPFASVSCSADAAIIYVGASLSLHVSTNTGTTFTKKDVYTGGLITASRDGNTLLCAEGTGTRMIYLSRDGGTTWNIKGQTINNANVKSLTISPSGKEMIIITHGNSGYVYTSYDSGETWQIRDYFGMGDWQCSISLANGDFLVSERLSGYLYLIPKPKII